MPVYRVLGHDDLVRRALREGWVLGDTDLRPVHEQVPPVSVSDRAGQPRWLPSQPVCSQASLRLCLPDVIVHGGNLGLIVQDCIYPGGLAHSPAGSSAMQRLDDGRVRYAPVVTGRKETARLLGLVCHFGHFFVDALDRLLAMEADATAPDDLLVSDPDLFQLAPTIDDCGAVPQVSELIRAMGMRWTPRSTLAVPRTQDLAVDRLTVHTLRSTKPSVSAPSFVALRRRVGVPQERHSPGQGGLVFVARGDVRKRLVRNQDQMSAFVRDVHGGVTIFPEFVTIKDAIATFGAADRVLLPVGSAKFNLAFCRPGTRVICVNPRGYTAQSGGVTLMIRHICHALGLRLAFYEVDIEPQRMLLHSNLIFAEDDALALMRLFETMEAF